VTTYGDFPFPEAAPLIYPTLDVLGEQLKEAVKLREKIKRKEFRGRVS